MPSPFPGMNPYLEQEDAWHDFHDSFLPRTRDILNAQLGENYIAKIDEHIYIHDLGEEQRTFLGRADVAVAHLSTPSDNASALGVIESPVKVQLPILDRERECYLEILDRRSRKLITVIELLSPANKKTGPDRQQYIHKRHQLLGMRVNFVELDLLRGGPRMPFVDLPPCDYYAMVCRGEEWPEAHFWPLQLRDRLPEIPIPLREPDADLRLDLQSILHDTYDAAGYAKFIYENDPVPPLAAEDAAWARSLVPARP